MWHIAHTLQISLQLRRLQFTVDSINPLLAVRYSSIVASYGIPLCIDYNCPDSRLFVSFDHRYFHLRSVEPCATGILPVKRAQLATWYSVICILTLLPQRRTRLTMFAQHCYTKIRRDVKCERRDVQECLISVKIISSVTDNASLIARPLLKFCKNREHAFVTTNYK